MKNGQNYACSMKCCDTINCNQNEIQCRIEFVFFCRNVYSIEINKRK